MSGIFDVRLKSDKKMKILMILGYRFKSVVVKRFSHGRGSFGFYVDLANKDETRRISKQDRGHYHQSREVTWDKCGKHYYFKTSISYNREIAASKKMQLFVNGEEIRIPHAIQEKIVNFDLLVFDPKRLIGENGDVITSTKYLRDKVEQSWWYSDESGWRAGSSTVDPSSWRWFKQIEEIEALISGTQKPTRPKRAREQPKAKSDLDATVG